MRRVRCPKCRKSPEVFVEHWSEHRVSYSVDNNGLPDICECWEHEGDPYYVSARCECGHDWKIRGVRQIRELNSKG